MRKLCLILVLIGGICTVTCYEFSDDEPTAIDNIINNKDEDANIEEPCKDFKDKEDCLRDFFQSHARCGVVLDWDDEPVRSKGKIITKAPKVNTTIGIVRPVMNVKGIIDKFYINKNTGNLILAVRLSNFTMETQEAQIVVTQRGKEPKVIVDSFFSSYPTCTVTAVIPAGKNIAHDNRSNRMTNWVLERSTFSVFVQTKGVVFTLGPKFADSTDSVIAAAARAIKADLATVIQETSNYAASDMFLAYLQKFICNFGISSLN